MKSFAYEDVENLSVKKDGCLDLEKRISYNPKATLQESISLFCGDFREQNHVSR